MNEPCMKTIPVEQAVGHVLCHDMTLIAKSKGKIPWFRKGHIIREEDIPVLRSMGKERIYIWEKPAGSLHEDEAAQVLAEICGGDGISRKGPVEGKIELFAEREGLFYYDTGILNSINEIEDIVISARHNYSAVKTGDKLAAMKVVPLVIREDKLRQAGALAGETPLMRILPYCLKTAAVINTGTEVATGLIKDTFTPALKKKLLTYGIEVIAHIIVPDSTELIAEAIANARREQPDLILCSGGMSVDPDDKTPGAIRRSGAGVVVYGTPVMPGAMFMLAYFDDGVPVMGVPGCVMSSGATIFDMILPRVAAGLRLERRDFTRMAAGGLCLSCPVCRYPICPFGK